jgi:hypothetical protein
MLTTVQHRQEFVDSRLPGEAGRRIPTDERHEGLPLPLCLQVLPQSACGVSMETVIVGAGFFGQLEQQQVNRSEGSRRRVRVQEHERILRSLE